MPRYTKTDILQQGYVSLLVFGFQYLLSSQLVLPLLASNTEPGSGTQRNRYVQTLLFVVTPINLTTIQLAFETSSADVPLGCVVPGIAMALSCVLASDGNPGRYIDFETGSHFRVREFFHLKGALFVLLSLTWCVAWRFVVVYFAARPLALRLLGASALILYVPVATAAYSLSSEPIGGGIRKTRPLAQVFIAIAPLSLWLARFVDLGVHSWAAREKRALQIAAATFGFIPILVKLACCRRKPVASEIPKSQH